MRTVTGRAVALVAAAIVLAGCPTIHRATPRMVPLDEPHTLVVDGDYVNEPTRMTFPPAIAPFARVILKQYDRDGLHVSVGYNRLSGDSPVPVHGVVLTAFIYPSSLDLDDELAQIGDEILKRYEDARLVESGPVELSQGARRVSGLRSLHGFLLRSELIGTMRRLSETYLFRVEKGGTSWSVKYRISYPEEKAERFAPEIRAFLETLRLP